jgi:hypothetical protein
LEAGKSNWPGDTVCEASTDDVVDLKKENTELKVLLLMVVLAKTISLVEQV